MNTLPNAGPADQQPPRRQPLKRLLLLVATILAGAVAGAIGHRLSGDPRWYGAIPVALALVWWFVANPEDCTRCK